MEEVAKNERKRLRDLARYAKDEREQRYWEIYWARHNVFPAAMRSIMTEREFRKWWQSERDSQSRWFDPAFVAEMEPLRYEGWEEDPHDWPAGPEEWVEGRALAREKKFVDGGAFDLPAEYAEGYKLRKERDIKRAVRFVVDKFFGRRFYGNGKKGHYAQAVEQILNRTMYGYDLRLAEAYTASKALREIVSQIKEEKDDRRKMALMNAASKILWGMKVKDLEMQKMQDVDPLETRGKSWRKTRREHIIAKFGPKALMDGLDIATSAAVNVVRDDRRIYKKRAVLNALVRSKIESAVSAMTGIKYNGAPEKDKIISTVSKVPVNPYGEAAKILEEELRNVKSEEDFKAALKRAVKRILASRIAKSSKTPDLFANYLVSAVADFYRDYYKKHGRFPIITSMNDVDDVLREIERRVEREIRGGPNYYFKGYVLGRMRQAKQALKGNKARS